MLGTSTVGGRSRNLVLAAMIFAVSMTFIDQTIVAIAAPQIQRHLGLQHRHAVGDQRLPAFARLVLRLRGPARRHDRPQEDGGARCHRVRRILGNVRPDPGQWSGGGVDRDLPAVQGLGGAIMFPAALAIVVQTLRPARTWTSPRPVLRNRRRAHRYRPHSGWVPYPVDLAGDLLGQHPSGHCRSGPDRRLEAYDVHQSARIDYRGLVLIVGGVGLSVLGFQQSSIWGWGNPGIGACIAAGRHPADRVLFRRSSGPHAPHDVRIFRITPSAWRTSCSGSPC